MPRAKILGEMRPHGAIRPAIKELAEHAGCYIIVSSADSAAKERALTNRRAAMADAVADNPRKDNLHLEFYDQSRLATWVRNYPGVILWVRERLSKVIQAWHPHGPWANLKAPADDGHLIDHKLRVRTGRQAEDVPSLSPLSAATDRGQNSTLGQPGGTDFGRMGPSSEYLGNEVPGYCPADANVSAPSRDPLLLDRASFSH